MKKILIATTALVMTAGIAAAESHSSPITLSGTARMGVIYDGADTQFSSRVRIIFTASGETDGGLSFGATVRNDQLGNGNTANGDSTVFISGAFGTITMGDVAGGAADNLVGQVDGIGYTGLTDQNEIGFAGGTATAARYNFASGPFSFAIGLGQTTAADDAMSAAVKYSPEGGRFTVALGYSDTAAFSQIDAKATATLGAATIALRLADRETAADLAVALSVSGTFGGVGVTAFAAQNRDFVGTDTFGVGASYDLGGGAKVLGGVADNGTDTIAELGLNFTF